MNSTSKIDTNNLNLKPSYLILLIGALSILIAPFIHIFFNKKNPKIESEKKEKYSELVAPVNQEIKDNRSMYDNKIISAEDYIVKNDLLIKKLAKVEKEYHLTVKQIANKHTFFTWKTPRAFLLAMGTRLPYLLFSMIISYLIFLVKNQDKSLQKALNILQIILYTISFYLIVWCFWNYQDYPLKFYMYIILFVSLLFSISFVYYMKYVSLFRMKLTGLVREMFSFIFEEAEEENYIKEEKKMTYKRRRLELVTKATNIE